MGKNTFRIIRKLIRIFSMPMETRWEVPFEEGPCVFVPNHAGAFGPMDMLAKFEKRDRCHPWCNNGMMEKAEVPAYVRQDYWWKPGCKLEPLYDATLPRLASWLIPPILNSVPGIIPVYHDQRIMLTMRQSLRVLKQGDYLVVFPEQPSGYQGHHNWINTSWLRLGDLWYKTSGQALKLYPVHINYKKHYIQVAAPVWYDTQQSFEAQEQHLADALAKGLRG